MNSNHIYNDADHLLDQPSPMSTDARDDNDLDACATLLARVDFKWLMAGQGWWIDPHRFQYDMSYADAVLRLALASQSLALRQCAVSIQTRLSVQTSH